MRVAERAARTECGTMPLLAQPGTVGSIDMPASSTELLAKADAAAIRFLNTEAETGLTFARMAARTHNLDKKDRYRHYARLAYQTALGRLPNAKGTAEQMRETNLKIAELRELLGPDEKL